MCIIAGIYVFVHEISCQTSENSHNGSCAVSGDEELRLPLRKATPLSGKWASLAQVLSCGAEVEQAAPEAPVPSGSNSGSVHDENKAPANGSATVASHTVKLESAES